MDHGERKRVYVPFFFCELSSQHRGLTADASGGGNNKDANGPIDYALDMIGNSGGGGECVYAIYDMIHFVPCVRVAQLISRMNSVFAHGSWN